MNKKDKLEGLAKLAAAARARMEQRGLMSEFEMEAEEAKLRVGQAMVNRRLSDLPPEDGKPKKCPVCGKKVRVRKKAVPRTFKSLSGTHTYSRNQHYCEGCKETFYPRDEELGLPKSGEATLELEQRILDCAVRMPPEEAEQHWNFQHPSCRLSANQFRQTEKRLGNMAQAADLNLLQSYLSPPAQTPSDTVYFMSDGAMLLLRELAEEMEEVLGKGWREMKLGMVFRHENHLRGDDQTRGILSGARYAGDFSQEGLKEQLKAALDLECAAGTRRVVYLADGAPENWALASALWPTALQILDWYHAVQNVMTFFKKLLGEDNAKQLRRWKAKVESLLAEGKVDALVQKIQAAHKRCPNEQPEALEDILRYLRNNQARMDYPTYRRMGLLIGSGPIESAQRHVIQARMKRSGQRWSHPGARRMARLRTAFKTGGPQNLYRAIHWAYRDTIRNRHALDRLAACRKPPALRASNR